MSWRQSRSVYTPGTFFYIIRVFQAKMATANIIILGCISKLMSLYKWSNNILKHVWKWYLRPRRNPIFKCNRELVKEICKGIVHMRYLVIVTSKHFSKVGGYRTLSCKLKQFCLQLELPCPSSNAFVHECRIRLTDYMTQFKKQNERTWYKLRKKIDTVSKTCTLWGAREAKDRG